MLFKSTELVLLALLPVAFSMVTLTFQAFNSSCLDPSYLLSNSEPYFISLPNFYYAKIEVDLRHINFNQTLKDVSLSLAINNTDTGVNYTQNLPLNISVGTFSLFADDNLILNAYFTINALDQQSAISKSYLVSQSVSIQIVEANPQGREQSSFLFLVTNQDLISLPYNMITTENANNFNGYFISQMNSEYSIYSRQKVAQSYSDYWYGLSSVALPYLPYFSNCDDSGDYLYFSQLIHNASTCQLYGDKAEPINQFSFGSFAKADTCTISKKCVYDEIPGVANEYPYWNTLSTVDEVLFSVTAYEQSSNQLSSNFLSKELVPCKLKSTSGTNSSNMYPLRVELTFGYYQMTNSKRRIINCQVDYTLYVESSTNFTYNLVIKFAPLNHTKIMLNFGFDWFIYMLVFMIIGAISNFQFIIFWCYHLLVSVKKHWHFNIKIYARLYSQILKGVLPAFLIVLSVTFLVQIIMSGSFFGEPILGGFTTFWNSFVIGNVGYFASTKLTTIQNGRMGFSYVIIAGYLMTIISDFLIAKERSKQEYEDYEIMGRKFKPRQWNKGKFLFGSFAYIFVSIAFLFFTYTSTFGTYIWYIIAMMQVMQMVIEEISYSIFDDQLPCLPLKVMLGVLSYLATMGAIDLYYFILGYLVDVGISIIQIAYLNQLQEKITNFVEEKTEQINKMYDIFMNDQDDKEEKNSKIEEKEDIDDEILLNGQVNDINYLEKTDEEHTNVEPGEIRQYEDQDIIKIKFIDQLMKNDEEQAKSQVKNERSPKSEEKEKEKNEFESRKFQLIIDTTCGIIQYMVQPMVVLMLWITYQTSSILSNFAIAYENCILYLLSSIVLALFYQFNIIIIFHVLELYLNFDYKGLLKKLLDRVDDKKTFWITDEGKINKDIQLKIRGAYSYSISSQMFFHVTLYTCCMYQFINGCMTMITAGHNIFKDPFCLFILVFWIFLMRVFIILIKKVIHILDIWGSATLVNEKSDKTEAHVGSDEESNELLVRKSDVSVTRKFTFKEISNDMIDEPPPKEEEDEFKKIKDAKMKTICKKLQPQFDQQRFRLEYARKHKDYIRNNIEKILPLIGKFPSNDIELMGKSSSNRTNEIKSDSKNCDPMISDFLSSWLKRVEINRAKRQEKGCDHEGELKKCNFCFKTWGLYYGFDGMCLQCSKQFFKPDKRKQKEEE